MITALIEQILHSTFLTDNFNLLSSYCLFLRTYLAGACPKLLNLNKSEFEHFLPYSCQISVIQQYFFLHLRKCY